MKYGAEIWQSTLNCYTYLAKQTAYAYLHYENISSELRQLHKTPFPRQGDTQTDGLNSFCLLCVAQYLYVCSTLFYFLLAVPHNLHVVLNFLFVVHYPQVKVLYLIWLFLIFLVNYFHKLHRHCVIFRNLKNLLHFKI